MTFYSPAQNFDLFAEKLSLDLRDELQAKGSKLDGVFETDTQNGNKVQVKRIQARNSVKELTNPMQQITYVDDVYEERFVDFKTFWDAAIHTKDEIIRMAMDPSDKSRQQMANDFGRKLDRYIISQFEADVSVKSNGSLTTLSFANDGGSTIQDTYNGFVTVGQSTGSSSICLTPGKLKNARKTVLNNNNSLADMFVLLNPTQAELLLTYPETHNRFFRSDTPLEKEDAAMGLQGYLGMNFIIIDDASALPQQSSKDVVYLVSRKAMLIRKPSGMDIIIDQDTTIVRQPMRIQMVMDLGAIRLDGKHIVKILCDPAVNIPA